MVQRIARAFDGLEALGVQPVGVLLQASFRSRVDVVQERAQLRLRLEAFDRVECGGNGHLVVKRAFVIHGK